MSDLLTLSLAIDKNNALLLTGSDDRTCRVWELSTYECLYTLKGHKDYIIAVAFEETRDIYAVTASADKTIRRWGPFPLEDETINSSLVIRPYKEKGKINDIKEVCF